MLLDIPESFETERLLIRAPRSGDGAAINEALLETFEDLTRWMPWAKERPTVEQSEEYARKSYSQFISRENLFLSLFHKETGLLVGCSGLHRPDWAVPKFEIGYWCRKQFERQGLITEAVRGILKFGFETVGARRIEIRCDIRNDRSRRVAERVGMKREAELRDDHIGVDGVLSSTLTFGMTLPDWKELHGAINENRLRA